MKNKGYFWQMDDIRCRLDVNLEVDFSVVSTTNESKSLKLFILSDLFAYIKKKVVNLQALQMTKILHMSKK
jgi:hypothetical protein